MELDETIKLDRLLTLANIAEELDEDDLTTIGEEVVNGYQLDSSSRSSWEEKLDDWVCLALQIAEKKTHPWPDAANVKYPLITTAALQFSARAYSALLPGTQPVRGRVIGYDPMGEKQEQAIRVGKHMSYQLLEEMEDWEEEMDRLLFTLPIMGCVFKKTYYSIVKGTNVSELIYPKELVVNYWAKNLEEAERVTHILHMSENDIYERVSEGLYLDEELIKFTDDETSKEQFEMESHEALGIDNPKEEDETTPYTILEQCTYIDFDGDGYKEPYIVTVDLGSKKVLRIVRRYIRDGIKYNNKGKVISIKPINYYTKFSFIPSPDGSFYDIGFGVLLGPINDTINTLINQLLDSGTLSNLQSGFVGRGIRVKGGNMSFVPGEWKTVNSIGDDLRKGLVPLPVREPSQVLFSLLGMMVESGEKLSSVTEVMTGEIPGQNTKATVAMAAIEQGMKVFSSIYKRIHRSLSKEYKKLFFINSIFLPEESYFNVLDIGQEGAQQIGKSDYDMTTLDVVPTSDPNVATEQQKLAKVEALGQLMSIGTINPQVFTRRYLEATEQPDIEGLMNVPPPQPNPEFEFERQKWQVEKEQTWEELSIKRMQVETQSLKNIADAEAAEIGRQLEQYRQQLETMQEDNVGRQKLMQLEEAHRQKMQQMDEAHRQKIAQQEEINREKQAQERSRTVNLQRGADGKISGAVIQDMYKRQV